MRRFPDKDQVKMGSEREASTTPAAQRPDYNPIGRRGAKLAKKDEDTSRHKV